MRRQTLGSVLLVSAIVAFALMLVASAALAPSRSATEEGGGPTIAGIHGGGFGLHQHGSVVRYASNGTSRWEYDGANSYFDVTRRSDGTVLAGFIDDGYEDCGPYDPPCSRTGFQIIDPRPTPHVVFEYSFPVRTKQNSEVHDVEELPSGDFLLTDMEYERILIVDRNGTIQWQWNASSRYDGPDDPTTTDWLHINDVDRIGDGRYLVSVRNRNQLLVIERGRGVTDVVNRDRNRSVLFRQHNPQWLGENAVLVADSGNDRIVELHRNTSTDEWRIVWSLHRVGGLAFDWPRDADRLPNGNTLVTDTVNQRIVEVDESGALVWSLRTDHRPYEADRLPVGESVGGPLYRANSTRSNTSGTTGQDGRRVSPVYHILRTAVPLPYWFGDWQLLGTIACFLVLLSGGWLRKTS